MLWTTLRWNWGNTLAVAAFCLLPIIGFAEGGFSDKEPMGAAPSAELQSCVKPAGLPNIGIANLTSGAIVDCA